MKKDDKLSWGITLLFFGILFMLKIFRLVPGEIGYYAFNVCNYPIVAGIIFFIFNKNRNIGIALILLGIFMRFDALMHLSNDIPMYVWPGILILAGVVFIWGFKGGK